ncbi:MAG: hypothetical protein Wins2KO_22480 [Winogradskyella sp.]
MAFEKAKEEIQTDKNSPRAQLLSNFILENSKEPYGEKSLRDKYNSLINKPDSTIRLKKHVEEALSHYLGYKDYRTFLESNNIGEIDDRSRVKILWGKNKITIVVSLIIITTVLIYSSLTRQRWMIWQVDHYEEVRFDLDEYDVGQLKLYKKERIEKFRKIEPDCSYKFFNAGGSVKVWYGKNNGKELEFFTDLGLHPETGKTLKPITQYMIDKYLCE